MFFIARGVRNQYIAALSACLSMLATGTCFCWITPVLPHLTDPDGSIHLTTAQLSWVVSSIEIGYILSPIPSGLLINYVGRKPVLLATLPLYIIGWISILYLPNYVTLGAARIIHGFALGAVFTVTPVYLGEIASDKYRGAIASMSFNAWWLGFLIQYAVGPFLSFYHFTYFTIAMHIPFLLTFIWQPETPYYYIMVNDEKKAYKSLAWFRDSSAEQLGEELQNMKTTKANQNSKGLRDLLSSSGERKALCILCAVAVVRIVGGNGALAVFQTKVFSATPNLPIAPHTATIICGVVMFLGGCISSFTLDTFGRRSLLLVSCVGSLFCQFTVGTFYYLLPNTSLPISQISWLSPILIFLYWGLCTAGMYPVCTAYTSELFNTNTRGVASSVSNNCVTCFSFLMLLVFQPLSDFVGVHANFYMFSIFLLLACVYFYKYAPETKGKSFEQIRNDLIK